MGEHVGVNGGGSELKAAQRGRHTLDVLELTPVQRARHEARSSRDCRTIAKYEQVRERAHREREKERKREREISRGERERQSARARKRARA